jgi:DUF4097 and DUF4098 domain-containing protein YvlB
MAEPARIKITTRSGSVRVVAAAGQDLSVEGGTVGIDEDGTTHIRRAKPSSVVEVRCAAGTDVTVGTVSGRVDLSGPLGSVRVATVSGRIQVGEGDQIDVRTKSGKIDIDTCAGECRVMTKSSGVHVRSAGRATVSSVSGIVLLEHVGGAEVKTVSGKVLIGTSGDERVAVHSVSGKVEIRVPRETRPATRLRSLSGQVRSEVTPGDDREISVMSVSGAIRVSSA